MVASDELVVRLVEPDGHPETVIILWPDHATVAQPARFAEVAATATRRLADASTELTRLRSAHPVRGGPVTEVRYPDITVQLTGTDGNAFAVLGRVRRALLEAGVDEEEVSQFTAEATSSDYDKLLQTATRWVDVA